MGDIVLAILIVTAISVVWIEWAPPLLGVVLNYLISFSIFASGIADLPSGWGQSLIAIGVIYIVSTYFWSKRKNIDPEPLEFSIAIIWRILTRARDVFMTIVRWCRKNIAAYFQSRERTRGPAQSSSLRRTWIGMLALIVSSPFAAVFPFLILATFLTVKAYVLGELGSTAAGPPSILKPILGYALFGIFLTLDMIAKLWFVSLPLIAGAGFAGARYAERSEHFYRRIFIAMLITGVLYVAVFLFVSAMGWYEEPYID